MARWKIIIRLLYYLPMESMKTQVELLKESCDIKDAACVRYQKRIAELEEENKNLKEFKTKREESRFYFKAQMERAEPKTAREAEDLQKAKELFEKLYRQELSYLEEENKKLKEEIKERQEEVERFKSNAMADADYELKLEQENKNLTKCNLNLQEWLDNKEKVNKSLREENEQLKLHVEAKDKAYMNLLTDYNYLQARIKRMEKAFLEYVENHKKLEDELDDVIMNR
jgi:chromosome segregation ATPase